MKGARSLIGIVALAVACVASVTSVGAYCIFDSVPVFHGLGGYYSNCPDAEPAYSFAYSLANPTGAHSNDQRFACLSAGTVNGIGVPCQPESGVAGDGLATLFYDWSPGNPGAVGCPVNFLGTQNGDGRLLVGFVPRGGRSLLVSVGYFIDSGGYLIEGAHPWDGVSVSPLSCPAPGAAMLEVSGLTSNGVTVSADLVARAPSAASDCDPGTPGSDVLGTCPGGPSIMPSFGRGKFYVRTALCPEVGGSILLRRNAWTWIADPAANGTAHIAVPAPAAGYCLSIGASFTVDGVESPFIGGLAIQPSDQPCLDSDADGYFSCFTDCDDGNADRHPGHAEVCDGIDNDCDGQVDEGIICQGACYPPRLAGSDTPVAEGESQATSPVLVWTGDGYGMAWFGQSLPLPPPPIYNAVFFARLDAGGNRIGPLVTVSQGAFHSSGTTLAWTGSEFGIAWMDKRSGRFEIYFTRFASDGTPLMSNTAIVTSPRDATWPYLVWNGSEYGLVWLDNRDDQYDEEIYFARIDALGARIGPDVRVTTLASGPYTPRLAWNGGGYGLSWTDRRLPGGNVDKVFFARLDGYGAKLAPEQRVSDLNAAAFGVSLVWTGSGYALAWGDSRNGLFFDIYFNRLDTMGLPLGPDVRVTTPDSFSSIGPSLAWTGAEYGVTWADARDGAGEYEIYFAGLTEQGQKIGDDVRVTHATFKSADPSMIWNGSEFALGWKDQRRDGEDYEPFFTSISCGSQDRDRDGYVPSFDCNDARRDIHPDAVEFCDGVDNNCDGRVDEGTAGLDQDADGVAGACDNCPAVANADQGDADADGEGDLCDFNDGAIWVESPDHATLAWQPETTFGAFNVYRGSLAVLRATGLYTQNPALVPGAARLCGVTGDTAPNGPDPAVGEVLFFLVTGQGGGVESSLGVNSAGIERPNANPCP